MSDRTWTGPLERMDDYRWQIPQTYQTGMRVPGLVFADEKLMEAIQADQSLAQVANVACLPGIVRYSLAMPDIHWGYGAPIGGVAAFDPDHGGVVSPGMAGYDLNCGVRLVRSDLTEADVQPKLRGLIDALFDYVPCGVGMRGAIEFSTKDAPRVVVQGARWAVERGYGVAEDLERCEENGAMPGANPEAVSPRAYERGRRQLGTLGSGNHFLEIQVVDTVFDEEAAERFGLRVGTVTVMIHSGSRGLGYQTCDDYLEVSSKAMPKYEIQVPDRQLACVPVRSNEGQGYLGAMRCAANYAWANRQCLMHLTREVFERVFAASWQRLGLHLIYDVCHNIVKFEEHAMNGTRKTLCVHRKGATRAFPPGHSEIPDVYRSIGQPVIIPGDMGRNSYLLVGAQGAMAETFGSCCHGAGRVMSRTQAVRESRGRSIERELESQGIIVRGRGRTGVAEEQPSAYKDVNEVVHVVEQAGLARRVARMRPLGVIKG